MFQFTDVLKIGYSYHLKQVHKQLSTISVKSKNLNTSTSISSGRSSIESCILSNSIISFIFLLKFLVSKLLQMFLFWSIAWRNKFLTNHTTFKAELIWLASHAMYLSIQTCFERKKRIFYNTLKKRKRMFYNTF